MKKFCLTTTIAVLILLFPNELQAQTSKPQLNQVELFKQLIGRWTAERGKDTTVLYEVKLLGAGIEDYMEYITNGKAYFKLNGLWGYDKKNDKYIHLKVYDPLGLQLNVFWFTSKNTCEGVQYQYISNPENSPIKWIMEFKTPDSLVLTTIRNSKIIVNWVFTREKE